MDLNSKTDWLKFGQSFFVKLYNKKELRNISIKKDINLLPRAILEQRRFDESFKKLCFIFTRVFILVFALLIIPYVLRLSLSFDKNSLEKRIKEISPIEDLEKQVETSRNNLKLEKELISKINKNDSVISVILTTMEKVIPKTMYLTSVSQQLSESKASGEKTPVVQKVVNIKGVARDKDSVADFQKSLKDTNMYKNVFVTNISEIDEKLENVVKVTVTNEFGDTIDKEIPLEVDFRIKVEFDMECILNDWE